MAPRSFNTARSVGFTGAISRAGGRNGLRARLRHTATPYGSYSCRAGTLGLPQWAYSSDPRDPELTLVAAHASLVGTIVRTVR